MRPLTVQVVRALVHVAPPGVAVTRYAVIAVPPLSAGAVQATTELVFAFEVAVTFVATPGVVAGTTATDAAEDAEFPDVLMAMTLNV